MMDNSKKPFFEVSYHPEYWEDDEKIFCLSSYIEKLVLDTVSDKETVIAKPVIKGDEDIVKFSNLVEETFNNLTQILHQRLNNYHNVECSEAFWRKIFAVHLQRYITNAHDCYMLFSENFSSDQFRYLTANGDSIYVPVDFEELRDLTLNSLYGNDVLFLCFCELKKIEECIKFELNTPSISKRNGILLTEENVNSIVGNPPKPNFNFLIGQGLQVLRGNLRISKYVSYCKEYFSERRKRSIIGLLGVYFEQKYLKELGDDFVNFSFARIGYGKKNEVSWNDREELFISDPQLSEFENYLLYSLKYFFPRILIEDFESLMNSTSLIIKKLPKFEIVIAELWISNGYHSFLLSYLKEFGKVKHINNEHNVIAHPYLGRFTEIIIDNSDYYFNIGWKSNMAKVVQSASLKKYTSDIREDDVEKGKVLFVEGAWQAKLPTYSTAYSLCGDYYLNINVQFIDKFFRSFSENTNITMAIRPYPTNYGIPLLLFNKDKILNIEKYNFLKENDFSIKANRIFKKYELIILDYIGTSFLEVMIANKPFVILKPEETYGLKNEYVNIFEELERVGIIQTDAKNAVSFIESVMNIGANEWWSSPEIQEARVNFMTENIGDPKIAITNYKKLLDRKL